MGSSCEVATLQHECSARSSGGEMEDEKWRLGSTTLVRRVAGESEDENW